MVCLQTQGELDVPDPWTFDREGETMNDSTPYDPRTLEGLRNGFSWCRKCGGTWNWKRTFPIPSGDMRWTFPVCFECGWDMPIDEILVHLKAVSDGWEPYTRQLPDGTVVQEEPLRVDMALAEKWLRIWENRRKTGEDPYQVEKRLRNWGPKDWAPGMRGGITEV